MQEDRTSTLDHAGAHTHIFGDASEEQAQMVFPALGAHQMGTFGDTATGLGWKEHPSTYVLTTLDKVFSPELQRTMASNATNVVEVESAHVPGLTQAGKVADILAAAAND